MSPSAPPNSSDKKRLIKEVVLTLLIPLVYPLGLFIMWLAPKEFGFGQDAVVMMGWGFGIAGLVLWIAAMLNLGKSLDVLPGADHLVKRGLYRRIRHPVYLGITLTFLGLVLCLGSRWGLAYVLGIVIPVNWVRARLEERVLEAKFQEEYFNWRAETWF